MCNRYRMSAEQVNLARAFGVPEHLIMPEPEPLSPPELFPKRIGWIVRNVDGARTLDTKAWGIPRKMRGVSGKMLTTHVTNVRNLESPFWRSTLANPHYRCLVPFTSFAEPKPGKNETAARHAGGSTFPATRLPHSPASGGRLRAASISRFEHVSQIPWWRRFTPRQCRSFCARKIITGGSRARSMTSGRSRLRSLRS